MIRTLGYVTPVAAYLSGGEIYMQAASGRVAEELATHFDRVYLCARVVPALPLAPFDPPLNATNLEIIAQPYWSSTAASIFHFFGILRAYFDVCRRSDALIVRGMCPHIAILYLCAAAFRRPVCHWIVGDPVALLRAGGRPGGRTAFALLYALQDRWLTRFGRWFAGGTLLCNGGELARAYASPRTAAIASGTIRESEFYSRIDTCQGATLKIFSAGFLRPEKGIEYLLDAVSRLGADLQWELEIVGPRPFPEYSDKLQRLAETLGVSDRVHWDGYVPNGKPLFDLMRAADLFVLPSLSEGTPHVLVEARANGLPCISTTVGGVPSTVTHGYDALLVPPKDARALARAIERLARDGELRRALIRNGLNAAHKQTLDRFIYTLLRELNANTHAEKEVVPQE